MNMHGSHLAKIETMLGMKLKTNSEKKFGNINIIIIESGLVVPVAGSG